MEASWSSVSDQACSPFSLQHEDWAKNLQTTRETEESRPHLRRVGATGCTVLSNSVG